MTKNLALACSFGLSFSVAAGCVSIYGDLSDIENDVPIHESENPAGLGSEQYAVGFGFGGTVGAGTSFIALGREPDGVALLSYDQTGDFSADQQPLPADVSFDARPPIAGLAASESVLVGMRSGDGAGVVGLFSPNGLQPTITVVSVPAPPTSVALGSTGFGPGTADAIVAGGEGVTFIDDYLDTAMSMGCPGIGAKAVVVADFVNGGDLEVGVVNATSFEFLSPPDDGTTPCGVVGTVELDATGGDGFADEITVGDFDGNGAPDVAVGHHTADRVYVLMNPDGVNPPTVETIQGDGGTRFGTALAAGDIDGMGADQLIIGASGGVGRGVAGAGVVLIYGHNGTAMAKVAELANGVPESGENYGRAVGVVSFANGRNLIAVGGPRRVFLNFRDPLGAADPRVP